MHHPHDVQRLTRDEELANNSPPRVTSWSHAARLVHQTRSRSTAEASQNEAPDIARSCGSSTGSAGRHVEEDREEATDGGKTMPPSDKKTKKTSKKKAES